MTTCGLEVEESLAEYLDEQEEVLAAEFTEMGINVYEFSDEELARINTALKAASQL